MRQYNIGILGGGQLGRLMLAQALGWPITSKVLDPETEAPAARLATQFVQGSLTDYQTVLDFGQDCQCLTIEIENVNVAALQALEAQGKTVIPSPRTIALIQDKCLQKQFYHQSGIPTADFVLLSDKTDLQKHLHRLPAVQKLAREGYDGRGVQILRTADELDKAFDAPSILEALADIRAEVAVLVARNTRGEVVSYPATEVVYHPEHNLVDYLLAPARIPEAVAARADALARRVAETMDFVGLLAVELFWTTDDQLWVNEVAPRPHNSGHHTIEANATSQYAQLLRVLLDLPLGSTDTLSIAAMVNLLGAEGHTGTPHIVGWEQAMQQYEGIHCHLYGKKITKPFRKMGHLTLLASSYEALYQRIAYVQSTIKVLSR